MTDLALRIDLSPAQLGEGTDYEQATFGLLEISAAGQTLTAGIRTDADGRRNYAKGPHVSGYHLAEWLVWNWWRLRWEPSSRLLGESALEWSLAHRVTAVGEGYVWPNITIASDGFQCELTSERSREPNTPLFYYIGTRPVTVQATEFEDAVDRFINLVLPQVENAGLANTDLQKLWDDLNTERSDLEFARFRRFEALLGFDPDETDTDYIEKRLNDATLLGENALDELAIGAAHGIVSAEQISDSTTELAFDMYINDALRLERPIATEWGTAPAWQIGVATADAVRQQAGLDGELIGNDRLADLAGISHRVIGSDRCTETLSWVFQQPGSPARVALRPLRHTGRRFDVARLIGDRLFSENKFTDAEPLLPATGSYSYRQKAQRAFAAELLSPWNAVKAMLNNDYSPENREQVADHFIVSPMTIGTQMVNHGVASQYRFEEWQFNQGMY